MLGVCCFKTATQENVPLYGLKRLWFVVILAGEDEISYMKVICLSLSLQLVRISKVVSNERWMDIMNISLFFSVIKYSVLFFITKELNKDSL